MRGILAKPAVRSLFLFLALLGMVIPLPCQAQVASDVIKFGVFPFKSPKSVIEVFGPLAARLEARLGKKVQLVSAPDAATFLTKGLAGEYDLALAAVTVSYKMRPAGYTVIARGLPPFFGGLIVRQESEIKTIDQCRGKKIAAIGEHAYAGYIFFKELLDEKKIDAKKDLEIHFLGKLDSIIYGVLNKQYDGGLIRLDTLDMKEFASIKDRFRVVVRSCELPHFPFMVKGNMDQRTVAIIREVLTSLSSDNQEDLEILKGMQVKKIAGATNADYDQFYEIIKDSEYYKKNL
ncbi:MAG: phosphate/phosphite/phosphonate ABC transporter substrate-binding protein [Desulfobulbaceae bacterium]|nr:phosphate/phosphite/phosphonate ABC transporter substrate-binding protein [Desulfobulbaceae bacterium]HIJ91420.1 phosphate/phosphite/phosphonate ABC transporter substrate-binding protein [Deltaproteobacteria bacterium]